MDILKNENVKIISAYDSTIFEGYLKSFGYPINKKQHINRTHVDWQSLKGFSFFYDYVGNEDLFSLLMVSKICNPDRKIILELNVDKPIIELSSRLFAENWEDIINENSYGISGMSSDGELIFEFTDDSEYLLHSNFFIK